jgi:hypothetical protein
MGRSGSGARSAPGYFGLSAPLALFCFGFFGVLAFLSTLPNLLKRIDRAILARAVQRRLGDVTYPVEASYSSH